MNSLRYLPQLISWKTLWVSLFSIISTWFCREQQLTADFPLTLMATAVIFPIVFSIGGAYKRREQALDAYGAMKAHGRGIYFAARDWVQTENPERLPVTKEHLHNVFSACRTLFLNPKSAMRKHEKKVYLAFSDLSKLILEFRKQDLATGEVSRCNQYLGKMMVAFEKIKHIYQYRTPRTLRAYGDFFIIALPIVYGPYFAKEAIDYSPGLVYVMPVLFSVILVALDNIQAHLENPFDQIGHDDVTISVEQFVENLSAHD